MGGERSLGGGRRGGRDFSFVGHEGGDCVLVSWRKKKGGEGRYRRCGRARLTRL
jgi:hypothetical protein